MPNKKIHPSHVTTDTWGAAQGCLRCKMCTCHSMHKMIEECERVDGRKKNESSGSE